MFPIWKQPDIYLPQMEDYKSPWGGKTKKYIWKANGYLSPDEKKQRFYQFKKPATIRNKRSGRFSAWLETGNGFQPLADEIDFECLDTAEQEIEH